MLCLNISGQEILTCIPDPSAGVAPNMTILKICLWLIIRENLLILLGNIKEEYFPFRELLQKLI